MLSSSFESERWKKKKNSMLLCPLRDYIVPYSSLTTWLHNATIHCHALLGDLILLFFARTINEARQVYSRNGQTDGSRCRLLSS